MKDLFSQQLLDKAKKLFAELRSFDLPILVEVINELRLEIHQYSPFKDEPVDCVQWIPAELVTANDYNPNSVAPPEMKLLEHSILQDGYTQPIVVWPTDDRFEVIDGFHRNRVGKESAKVRNRVHSHLPITIINDDRTNKGDRIAATIRHNRARGKHRVEAMSDIVIELKRRNWSDERISKELGMDSDEVLRLCQITGLAEVFKDQAFSEAWEVDRVREVTPDILSDVISNYESNDDGRIYHTWDKWECYKAGFYAERCPNGMTQEQGMEIYREFLSNLDQFEAALKIIISEWRYSCEHYLTNDRMNRIAWLGQASMAQAKNIPSGCRGGYQLLTEDQRKAANDLALKYLNLWLTQNNREPITLELAMGRTEAELY